ncbi:MAG: hypothetical protein HKN68_01785 [Saprospiraceae bacterium]|nr:hypothetical protein [Saprospiraceae bacterium]
MRANRDLSLSRYFNYAGVIIIFSLFTFILRPINIDTELTSTLCNEVIGEWKWDQYGTVYIFPDGTTEHIVGDVIQNTGKWLCDIDVLKVEWTKTGWSDRLKINASGTRMEGSNQKNMPIVATRIGESGFSSNCVSIVGKWEWGSYGTVNIFQDGTTQHFNGGQLRNTGKWACENGKIRVRWTNGGYTDRLMIKTGGNVLIGQNRQGMPIRAARI